MLIDEALPLKKLETFLVLMRTGNLGRAAAELVTSAVSVHRAIHTLESALRCPLFKHEGRQLIQEAEQMVRHTREPATFYASASAWVRSTRRR